MNSTQSHKGLTNLVCYARKTAGKVTQPIPKSLTCMLVEQDGDALLAGLSLSESLTGFHPFAAAELPIPMENASDKKDQDRDEHRHTRHYQKKYFNQQVILNRHFAQLVNDVLSASGPARRNAEEKQAVQTKAGIKQPHREPETASSYSNKTHIAHKKNLVERYSSICAKQNNMLVSTTEKHPLFEKLETLVYELSHHHAHSYPVDQSNESAEDHSTAVLKPEGNQQHLETLTTALLKTNAIKTQLEETAFIKKQKKDNNSNITNHQQNPGEQNIEQASSKASMASLVSQGMLKQKMPDLLHRSPNLKITEATQRRVAFDGVSPFVAHQLADALNDYLQEQAELHGVDLS